MIIKIALVFFTVNLCIGKDNEFKWTIGFYWTRHKCAVRGCTKPCKKKNMIGSMFGRQYFCDEHYDEICSANTHK